MKQIVTLVLLLYLGSTTSEIEVTFSNEDDDEQSFVVQTESLVLNNSDSPSSILTPTEKSLSPNGVIAVLKILKGSVVLLEKTTADIGRDGYDMDIQSDLLDTGENELDLLLLSATGDIIQQEKISVFSPPISTDEGNNDCDNDVDVTNSDNGDYIDKVNAHDNGNQRDNGGESNNNSTSGNIRDNTGDSSAKKSKDSDGDGDGDCDSKSDSTTSAPLPPTSPLPPARPLWKQQCSSLYARLRSVASTSSEDRNVRLVTATCGTMGVVAGGAWLYGRGRAAEPTDIPSPPPQSPPPPPAAAPAKAPTGYILPPRNSSPNKVKKKKNPTYQSKFPRYPLAAASSPIDFASPKALPTAQKTVLSTSTPASGRGGSGLVTNVKDLLLGQPRRPKAYSLLLQGGVALLGVQAAKSFISQISHAKDTTSKEKEYSQGRIFRVGTSQVKRRWSLGRLLRKKI